jgi:quercetin 2,3-dioxygenase
VGPDAQVDDRTLYFIPADPPSTDPFLLLSEDWFSSPGFEWHPHRGIETVTTVVGGVLEHGDNLGNAGALVPGDMQCMTAGHGIIHRELAFRNERAHTLQLWLNLPARSKLIEHRYQDLTAVGRPKVEGAGTSIDLVAGTAGDIHGPAQTNWPVTGAIVGVEPEAAVRLPLPARHRVFALPLVGAVRVAGRTVHSGQIAWSDPLPAGGEDSVLRIESADRDRPSRVMVFSGLPINEPVVMGGSFVMNTEDEIVRAYRDFEAGRFGEIPRQARLKHR